MTILNALVVTAFLILFATSVAVVGSIIVLAIFDLTFAKKQPSVVAETTESDQLDPPSQAVQ